MANYHDFATFVSKNPSEIGLGFGDDENGQKYICLAGLREKIETKTAVNTDWVSLTPECALELFELLSSNREWFDNYQTRKNLANQRGLPHAEEIEPIPSYGDLLTIDDFVAHCDGEMFIDDDGHGYWANETHVLSKDYVYPSLTKDIVAFLKAKPENATHIVWFNR